MLLLSLAFAQDADNDGLTDPDELSLSFTDPQDEDSDNDGLLDGEEFFDHGTDPNDADTDGDGLSDGEEVLLYGSDPQESDTDGGGVDDGEELEVGTDPTDAGDDVPASNGAFNGGCVNGCSQEPAPVRALWSLLRRR